MIWEWWQYLTTPVPKYVKEMGYLHEAIAMAARAKRCRVPWQSHYQKCQTVINEAMQRCEKHRTALIMGAGSLNDIPLSGLSEQFETVYLIDLVFLKSAKQQAAMFRNVHLIEADVTESVADIFKGQTLLTPPQAWLNKTDIDLVVSLNILTQLPLLPAKWLLSKYALPELALADLSQTMIQQHLDYIQKFNATVCLIADRWDTEFDASGKVLDEFDPWWEVEQPDVIKSWEWELMPVGEVNRSQGQKNRVGVSYL